MPQLPVLKPREVEKRLKALGFEQARHSDGRATTVPFHAGRDISPILLRKIASDIGLTAEALINAK